MNLSVTYGPYWTYIYFSSYKFILSNPEHYLTFLKKIISCFKFYPLQVIASSAIVINNFNCVSYTVITLQIWRRTLVLQYLNAIALTVPIQIDVKMCNCSSFSLGGNDDLGVYDFRWSLLYLACMLHVRLDVSFKRVGDHL